MTVLTTPTAVASDELGWRALAFSYAPTYATALSLASLSPSDVASEYSYECYTPCQRKNTFSLDPAGSHARLCRLERELARVMEDASVTIITSLACNDILSRNMSRYGQERTADLFIKCV